MACCKDPEERTDRLSVDGQTLAHFYKRSEALCRRRMAQKVAFAFLLIPVLLGSLHSPSKIGVPKHFQAVSTQSSKCCHQHTEARLGIPAVGALVLALRGGRAKKQRRFEPRDSAEASDAEPPTSSTPESDKDWTEMDDMAQKVPSETFRRRGAGSVNLGQEDSESRPEYAREPWPNPDSPPPPPRVKPGNFVERPLKFDGPSDESEKDSTSSIPHDIDDENQENEDEEKRLRSMIQEGIAMPAESDDEVFKTTPEEEEAEELAFLQGRSKTKADGSDESEFRGPGAPQPGTRAYTAWLMHEARKNVPKVLEEDEDLSEIEYLTEQTRGMAQIIADDARENPERYARTTKNETLAHEWRMGMRNPDMAEVGRIESSEGDDGKPTRDEKAFAPDQTAVRMDTPDTQAKAANEASTKTAQQDHSDEVMKSDTEPAVKNATRHQEASVESTWPVEPGSGGIGILFEDRPLTTSMHKDKEKGPPDPHRDWGVVVDGLVDGGSAAESDVILPGDVLIEVNGVDMRGKRLTECAKYILGKVGTYVTLKLTRSGRAYTVKLQRRSVAGNTVDRISAIALKKEEKRLQRSLRKEAGRQQQEPSSHQDDGDTGVVKSDAEGADKDDVVSEEDSVRRTPMLPNGGLKRDAAVQTRKAKGIRYTTAELKKARVVLEDHNGFRSPHDNISHALVCADGLDDTIVLRKGIYDECVTLMGCTTIEADEDLAPNEVVIRGRFDHPAVTCTGSKADVRIVGVSIRHGGGSVYNKSTAPDRWTRGVYVTKGAKLTLAKCRFVYPMNYVFWSIFTCTVFCACDNRRQITN
jgi:hypothetical protein